MRKGMMVGRGKGYYNYKPMFSHDRKVHQMSGKGMKQPQRIAQLRTQLKDVPTSEFPELYKIQVKEDNMRAIMDEWKERLKGGKMNPAPFKSYLSAGEEVDRLRQLGFELSFQDNATKVYINHKQMKKPVIVELSENDSWGRFFKRNKKDFDDIFMGKGGKRATELPIYKINGKFYFRDVKLQEYRNIRNPSDKLPINTELSRLQMPTMADRRKVEFLRGVMDSEKGGKGVVIDFKKAKYGSKEWEALKKKQEENKGKITKWSASTGNDDYEVKNGNLYMNGKKLFKKKGWGIGKGVTYYYVKERKYPQHISENKGFFEGYLKEIMKPYKIPSLPK